MYYRRYSSRRRDEGKPYATEDSADLFPIREGDRAVGSSIDDFLREEGVFEEAQAQAVKEVVAWQLAQAMKEKGISKNRMATLLKTSRTQVDRLLDAKNDITLSSLGRAAHGRPPGHNPACVAAGAGDGMCGSSHAAMRAARLQRRGPTQFRDPTEAPP
jgi:hypothetical protein